MATHFQGGTRTAQKPPLYLGTVAVSGSTNENWVTGHVHSYSRMSSRLGVSCARTRAYTCKWPRIYVYTCLATSSHPVARPGCATSILMRPGRAPRRVVRTGAGEFSISKFLPRYRPMESESKSKERTFEAELNFNDNLMPTRIFCNNVS